MYRYSYGQNKNIFSACQTSVSTIDVVRSGESRIQEVAEFILISPSLSGEALNIPAGTVPD